MRLATIVSTLVISAATLGAQQPPVPPRPAQPAPLPAPAARPAPAPMAPRDLLDIAGWDMDHLNINLRDFSLRADEIRQRAEDAALMASDRAAEAMALVGDRLAMAQFPSFGGAFGIDDEHFLHTPPAPWAQGDPADSLYRVAGEAYNRGEWRRAAEVYGQVRDRFPKSGYVSDCTYFQAFSLYRIGTTEDLRGALKLLNDVEAQAGGGRDTTRTTPAARGRDTSRSVQLAQYGALYGAQYMSGVRGQRASRADFASLASRIRGALAARGDQQAAAQLAQDAQKGGCDREDVGVRAEALSALTQMDPAAATPLLRRVLDRKDSCVELKRQAMLLLVRRSDSSAANALVAVAKNNDEDMNLRTDAISYLSRLPGDNVLAALEDLLRTSNDESIQRAAVHALASNDSPRARTGLRALIERQDAPERLRIEAINSLLGYSGLRYTVNVGMGGVGFGSGRGVSVAVPPPAPIAPTAPSAGVRGGVSTSAGGGRGRAGRTTGPEVSSDDAAFLRGVYPKFQSERLKIAVLDGLSRVGGTDNQQFLLGVVRSSGESSDVRSAALSGVGRSDITIAELGKLYDGADSRTIRERLISIFGQRTEPEATDKLGDIIKTGTDPNLRRQAINELRRKNDPRATKLLQEIIGS